MLNNPLIHRYRFSLLRPKQIMIYGFIYLAIVVMILLLNYTLFTTFMLFASAQTAFPFDIYIFIFYQFLVFQIIILFVWASYNSGSALTVEILRKSYIFFKLLPVTALQKALGVLIGTNLVAYSFALLNCIPLLIFAFLGKTNPVRVAYYLLVILAIAAFLNTLTLLLSINPDVKKKRRMGTLIIIVGALWGLMAAMGTLFAGNRPTPLVEKIVVDFFSFPIPGIPLFSVLLFYFTGWMLLGIMRKFRFERESLFSRGGSVLFFTGCEMLATGLFWSFFHLKNGFYGAHILGFWGLVFVNLGVLQQVERYYEEARRIRRQSASTCVNLFRLFLRSTLFWGICLFGIWTAFYLGLTLKSPLSPAGILFPLLNLFSFYLFFMVLVELFVLYRPAHVNIKVFLIVLAFLSFSVPLSLSKIFDNNLLYLHSIFGYTSYLLAPFAFSGGGKTMQINVFLVNLAFCLIPLGIIVTQYHRIMTRKA